MAGKAVQIARDNVDLGAGVVIPTEDLLALPVESYARNGVVLHNARVKVNLMNADNKPIGYTLSLYIQRDPLDDDEADGVNTQKAVGDAKRNEKAEKEANDRQKAVKAAFDMGQSATMGALRNIGDLAAGARALSMIK